MTYVVAQKFGERVVILSDTMITDPNGTRANAIPGRLKAIVLSGDVSLAYAGNSEWGLQCTRKAHQVLHDSGFDAALNVIVAGSSDVERKTEFLIVRHAPNAKLMKVSQGSCSTTESGFVIGDNVSRSVHRLLESPTSINKELEFVSQEEIVFTQSFMSMFINGDVRTASGVGGVPVNLLCSPNGHTYQGHSFAASFDKVSVRTGVTEEQLRDRASGMNEYRMATMDSKFRGVGVLACYLPAARTGYIYDPIKQDDAIKVRLLDPSSDWQPREHQMMKSLNNILEEHAASYDYSFEYKGS